LEEAPIAPDGSVAATSRERHGGPPYFWFAEVKTPAAGSWDAFPFVVKIRAIYTKPTGSFSICTATVLEPRLILTAAHCISKPDRGADGPDSFVPNISKDITIYYTDAGGQERTAKSNSTFYDRAFLSNFFKYTRIMPKQFPNEEARAKLSALHLR
jgi:hypothetical protein